MSRKLQFAGWFLILAVGVFAVFPAHGQNRPPKNNRQEQRQERRQEKNANRDQQRASASNPNRPPASNPSVSPNINRPPERARNQQNLNRPPEPTRNFNSLNPQEKQKTLDNYKNYQKLTPGQKQQVQEAARNWTGLTQEQKNHIKNDVMPRWQQLPPQRQRAIQQRLGVLKNMPESARNQHLNDPNFTRGMNEEDKATLRDLAHLHVSGAPGPPNE